MERHAGQPYRPVNGDTLLTPSATLDSHRSWEVVVRVSTSNTREYEMGGDSSQLSLVLRIPGGRTAILA